MYPRKLNSNELVDGLIVQCAAAAYNVTNSTPIVYSGVYYLFTKDGTIHYKGVNVDNSVTRQQFLDLVNKLPDSFAPVAPLDVWYETEITARLNIQLQRNDKLEKIGI